MVYKGPDCPPMGVAYNTSSLTTKRNTLSLTVLGTLQYHKKCYSIKTASISKNIRCKSINQKKVWWNKYTVFIHL